VLGISLVLGGALNVTEGLPIGIAVAVALLAGVLVGAVNAFFIIVVGVESIIVTLGTGTVLGGLGVALSGTTVGGISGSLVDAARTDLLGLPLAFYYGVALCILVWYMVEYTPVGRRVLFVGRGRNVARLSGIRVGRVRIGALMTSGLLAAGAGVLYAGTTGAADPNSGQTFLLPAFAAAFLGATTISPGFFNPFGAIVAVYFLQTGITGFQLVGVESYVQQLFYGGALVVAVAISQIARRREAQAMTG
jgi:ribose transport system permease protein